MGKRPAAHATITEYVLSRQDLVDLVAVGLSVGWVGALAIFAPPQPAWIVRSLAVVWVLLCLLAIQRLSRRTWRTRRLDQPDSHC